MTLVIKIVADQRRRINTITIPGYILNGLRISLATVCELLLYNTPTHTHTHVHFASLSFCNVSSFSQLNAADYRKIFAIFNKYANICIGRRHIFPCTYVCVCVCV